MANLKNLETHFAFSKKLGLLFRVDRRPSNRGGIKALLKLVPPRRVRGRLFPVFSAPDAMNTFIDCSRGSKFWLPMTPRRPGVIDSRTLVRGACACAPMAISPLSA
jgi:hypothetical protein